MGKRMNKRKYQVCFNFVIPFLLSLCVLGRIEQPYAVACYLYPSNEQRKTPVYRKAYNQVFTFPFQDSFIYTAQKRAHFPQIHQKDKTNEVYVLILFIMFPCSLLIFSPQTMISKNIFFQNIV